MDLFFPRKKIKIKYTDDPWISSYIKRRIRARKCIYDEEDRSDRWREVKKETNELIKKSNKNYYDKFKAMARNNSDPSLYTEWVTGSKTNKLQSSSM